MFVIDTPKCSTKPISSFNYSYETFLQKIDQYNHINYYIHALKYYKANSRNSRLEVFSKKGVLEKQVSPEVFNLKKESLKLKTERELPNPKFLRTAFLIEQLLRLLLEFKLTRMI